MDPRRDRATMNACQEMTCRTHARSAKRKKSESLRGPRLALPCVRRPKGRLCFWRSAAQKGPRATKINIKGHAPKEHQMTLSTPDDLLARLAAAKPQARLGMALDARPAHCRVAPSPTGFFHVGTARCALHNALAARASGGSFMLRLDDTDAARNSPAHAQLIDDCLAALGLAPDRFARQSERAARHAQAALALLDCGAAWRDADGSVRLSDAPIDALGPTFFDLAAGDVAITATSKDQCRGLTLLRSDGSATYPMASVCDDVDLGINFVLRGSDHLSNTPKQLAIAQGMALAGMDKASDFVNSTVFAHVGLITKDGKKVSKRDGGSNLADVLAQAPAAAALHWALRLGWSHPDSAFDRDWPVIDLAQMPSLFAQGRLKGANCDISLPKLASLAKAYAPKAPRP
jgi:glutamyl/glutaminyl-tRNA synthetase